MSNEDSGSSLYGCASSQKEVPQQILGCKDVSPRSLHRLPQVPWTKEKDRTMTRNPEP